MTNNKNTDIVDAYNKGYADGIREAVRALSILPTTPATMSKLSVGQEDNVPLPVTTPIEDLEFSSRVYNALKLQGLNTIEDVLGYSDLELKDLRNVGDASVREVRLTLADIGYTLRVHNGVIVRTQ